jgi:hypothetical protein
MDEFLILQRRAAGRGFSLIARIERQKQTFNHGFARINTDKVFGAIKASFSF